jgi:hypothetical protein
VIRHHDGNRGGRLLCRAGSIRCGDDHIDLEPNQLGRKSKESFGVSFRVPTLDDEVLPFAITESPQLLEQSAPDTRRSGLAQRDGPEEADSEHRRRRCAWTPSGQAKSRRTPATMLVRVGQRDVGQHCTRLFIGFPGGPDARRRVDARTSPRFRGHTTRSRSSRFIGAGEE